MFLKNRNISSKIKISKVTDYAALIIWLFVFTELTDKLKTSETSGDSLTTQMQNLKSDNSGNQNVEC